MYIHAPSYKPTKTFLRTQPDSIYHLVTFAYGILKHCGAGGCARCRGKYPIKTTVSGFSLQTVTFMVELPQVQALWISNPPRQNSKDKQTGVICANLNIPWKQTLLSFPESFYHIRGTLHQTLHILTNLEVHHPVRECLPDMTSPMNQTCSSYFLQYQNIR